MTTGIIGFLVKAWKNITVEPVPFLYMLGLYTQYSLFHDLVYSRTCLENYEEDICNNLEMDENKGKLDFVQTTASHWILLSAIANGIPTLFLVILLGSWSDHFGRKTSVLIPPIGGILASIILILIAFFPSIPIGWICLASFLQGATGGYISCIMSCFIYVSSITTEAERTVRIFRVESMLYLGGTVGPIISGSIFPLIGHGYTFIFMFFCYVASESYALLFVPDPDRMTRKEIGPNVGATVGKCSDDQRSKCMKYMNIQHFTGAVRTCFKAREGRKRLYIIALILSVFVAIMITAGEQDVAFLFAKDKPLFWDYSTYAYYIGYKFGLASFALLILSPVFEKFGISDTSKCIIGLISRILGLVCYALSTTTWIAFLSPIAAVFSSFTIPAIRSIQTKLVEPEEQGRITSSVAIVETLCLLTASLLFNSLYPLTRSWFRGSIFYLAGAISVIPILIIWAIHRGVSKAISQEVPPTIQLPK